ncbi:MAG: energy transducer TonB [Bacteroidales bacterium]|nr:energy transducer TonB [Bacteroidales bacterium]
MSRGKKICNQLKAVRQQIADENGIPFTVEECSHEGDCRGTCPRCEAEVRYLEQALTSRITKGRTATVAGLTLSLAACGGAGEPTLRVDTPLPDTVPIPLCDSIVTDVKTDSEPETDLIVCGMDDEDFLCENFDSQTIDSIPEPPALSDDDDEMILGMINETYPVFPGGEEALYKYLEDNIVFPENNGCADISGVVVVVFTIEKDGSVTGARIMRDICEGCGEAVLKAVNTMPKWKPGEVDGKPVRMQFSLPVQFDLKSED